MSRPSPPCPTLFPYTTLFRSHPPVAVRGGAQRVPRCRGPEVAVQGGAGLRSRNPDPRARVHRHHQPVGELVQATDRKSTRLNSSHITISYAVFCLKKKNTPTKAPHPGPFALKQDPLLPLQAPLPPQLGRGDPSADECILAMPEAAPAVRLGLAAPA